MIVTRRCQLAPTLLVQYVCTAVMCEDRPGTGMHEHGEYISASLVNWVDAVYENDPCAGKTFYLHVGAPTGSR